MWISRIFGYLPQILSPGVEHSRTMEKEVEFLTWVEDILIFNFLPYARTYFFYSIFVTLCFTYVKNVSIFIYDYKSFECIFYNCSLSKCSHTGWQIRKCKKKKIRETKLDSRHYDLCIAIDTKSDYASFIFSDEKSMRIIW